LKKVCILITIFSLSIGTILLGRSFSSRETVHAQTITEEDLYEELERLEEELVKIKQEKENFNQKIEGEKALQGSLTTQIYDLSNNISEIELNVKEKETDIMKKETETKILEEEITEARKFIERIESDVSTLEQTAQDIITTIYIETKTNSIIDILLSSAESTSFLSQIQYHTALGKNDQNTLSDLNYEKNLYEQEKSKLEDNKIEIEKLAEQIKKQKEGLEKDREQLSLQIGQKNTLLTDSQVAATYYGSQYENLSDEEKKKEAELDYILQQIVNSATKPKGYAVAGQIIATEGNNGCSTGPHTHFGYSKGLGNWVDPCNYLPYDQFQWGVCSGNGEIDYTYNSPRYSSRGYYYNSPDDRHQAIDLIAGPDKSVRAAHDGYYFEETPPCNNNWCWAGCKTSTNPCVKVCEDVECQSGKISIYCHVNFLSD